MRGVNKAVVLGNLAKQPEVRELNADVTMASFGVATSEAYTDHAGERKEFVEWHRVVVFGKLAEIAGKYLRKGSKVYIEGRMRTRKYTKDGIERYSTEVVVERQGGKLIMLDGKPEANVAPL